MLQLKLSADNELKLISASLTQGRDTRNLTALAFTEVENTSAGPILKEKPSLHKTTS
jgi:hypothetical protein